MRLAREKKRLIFSLNLIEGTLLRRAFEQLRAQYQLTPDELDPKTATAWYSSRGRQGSGMSVEDTRSWVEHLHQIKRAQVEKLEDWIRQITPAQPGPLQLAVSIDDADSFMNVINDQRLRLAAGHEIGQKEMDAHSPEALARLPIHQQEALLEIHVLAWFIQETLHALSEPSK